MNTNNDQCLQAFLDLAADHSHDVPTHPNTHRLQNFIHNEVLPKDPAEDKVPPFMEFVTCLAAKFDAAACSCETFQAVMQCIPTDAPDQKRIRHAVDKVALQLGVRQPII